MDETKRLMEFIEHVRREAFHLSHDLFGRLGVDDPAANRIAALGEMAADVKASAEMRQEQESIGELDLSTLPLPKKD